MGKKDQLKGNLSITFVRLLYDFLNDQGIDAARVLGEISCHVINPHDPQEIHRCSMTNWQALVTRAFTLLCRKKPEAGPGLALQVGARMEPVYLGVLGYVILSCHNLGQALERLHQYMQLMYDAEPMQRRLLDDDHPGAQAGVLELSWGKTAGRPGQAVDAIAIASLVHFARDITDASWQPLELGFINAPPADASLYQPFFACPVLFDAERTYLRLELADLALPLRQPDAFLLKVMEEKAQSLLGLVNSAGSKADVYINSDLEMEELSPWLLALRQQVFMLCLQGEPKLEALARAMFMSERTLQRHLQAEGRSFNAFLAESRWIFARQYLQDQRLQLAEIAQLLGYSEQSAFNRAYKQWTGLTPRQDRQRMLSGSFK
jgi:AraC-like DNA-binding protein